jgi:hypothetical protein
MVAGNMQASRIDSFPIRGGQLWMALIEKININRVEKQKIVKAQFS